MSLDRAGAVLVSVVLSVLLGAVLGFLFFSRVRRNLLGSEDWILIAFRCSAPFFAIFSIIYPIVEVLFTRFIGTSWSLASFFFEELKTGLLPARISSILIGTEGLRSNIDATVFDEDQNLDQNAVRFPEIEYLVGTTITKVYRNRHAHFLLGVFQASFYLWAMFVYWIATYRNNDYLWGMLLAFALFFVIGDWRVTFGLSLSLKGQIPKPQMVSIWFFNILLFGLAVMCLLEFSAILMVIMTVLGAALLFYSGYFSYGYEIPFLTSKFTGTLDWKHWPED